jgi:hypothetical protein
MEEDTTSYWESEETDGDIFPISALVDGVTLPELGHDVLDLDIDDEDDEEEFWDACTFGGDVLAFDVARHALDDAFEEILSGESEREVEPIQDVCNHMHIGFNAPAHWEISQAKEKEAKAKVYSTMSWALQSGALSREIENLKWETLRDQLHQTFTVVANTDTLDRVLQEIVAPCHETSKIAAQVQDAAPEPAEEAGICILPLRSELEASCLNRSPETPSRSSRCRRRVFGAVVRTPATEDVKGHVTLQNNIAPKELSVLTSKSSRRRSKHAPDLFNMDPPMSSSPSTNFESELSISRGYDASGANLYTFGDWKDSSTQVNCRGADSWQQAWKGSMFDFGALAVGRPASRSGIKPHTASMPAMAMDLGGIDSEQKLSSSISTGSLRSPKAKISYGGLLPMLPSSKKSAKSIAFTMQMSKTNLKWCDGGLHTSASAVF